MTTSAPTPHFLSGRRILVAGGGLSGLSFALALRASWQPAVHGPPPSVTVLERDASPPPPATVVGSDSNNDSNNNNNTGDTPQELAAPPPPLSVERDGYSLSLSGFDADGGLHALQRLGLEDAAVDAAVLTMGGGGGGAFKMWTPDFKELMSVSPRAYKGLRTAGIRIARRKLRGLLLDAAAQQGVDVRWGVVCVGAERVERDGGRAGVRVAFRAAAAAAAAAQATDVAAEPEEPRFFDDCDLLVAADGARSKLRGVLRPLDGLSYAGAVQLTGSTRFGPAAPATAGAAIPPPIDRNWGMVLSSGFGSGVACFLSPVDARTVVWALSAREPEARAPLYAEGDDEETRAEKARGFVKEALQMGKEFGEPFKTVVEGTDPKTMAYFVGRDKQPFRHRAGVKGKGKETEGEGEGWNDLPVVFIGDANHAVTPFAGNGANLALKDGWDLATCLVNNGAEGLDEALEKYDDLSYPRAVKTLESSHWRIKGGHGTGISFVLFRTMLRVVGTVMWLLGR